MRLVFKQYRCMSAGEDSVLSSTAQDATPISMWPRISAFIFGDGTADSARFSPAARTRRIGKLVRDWLIVLLGLLVLSLPGHAQTPQSANQTALSLTQEETDWLAAHRVVRLGIDPNYGPYSFLDEKGELQGVVREFLSYFELTLGLRFEIVSNLSWPQLMAAVQEKRIDTVATVVRLPEREAFLAFTAIYLPTPLIVITRDDALQLRSLDELSKLRLTLVEGYSSSKQVMDQHPTIRSSRVATPLDGLRAVASGMADAYVGALGVSTFLASQHGITNIKVNAAFDMAENGQRFGVRKDWPQLAGILDKALDVMPAKLRADIMQNWLPIQASEIQRLSQPTLTTRLFPWLLGLFALSVLSYLVLLLWNRQLKLELARRSAELEQAQAIAHMGDWSLDIASGRFKWSNELFRIAGRSPQEMDWPTLHGWIHPDERDAHADYLSRLATLPPSEHLPPLISHLLRPDGSSCWLEINCATDFDAQGKPRRHYGTALEITERKRAEAELQENETRLRLFIEHAPAALAMFDRQMRYLVVSHRWLTDYRLAEKEILGRSHYEVFPEIPDSWKEIHRCGLAGEVVRADEDQFTREDGSIQWLNWEVRPWYAANQAVGGIVIFSEDITARKEAETKARQGEIVLDSVFEALPDIFFLMESDGTIRDYRAQHGGKLYVPPEAFLGKRMQDVLPAEHSEIFQSKIDEIGRQGGLATYEYDLAMAEGQSHFEARLTRLPDSTQMIAVVRDITREHHDRNALAASEIRYRQLFEQSPAPLLVYEKGSLRLLAVNEAFIHHYGYSQDEALAMTLPDLYPDAERQSLIDMAAKLAGLSYVGEWHHLKKDGSPITIEARSHDMLYEGHAARIAVITDITKRKKMELRLLDQLEELTRWQAVMLGREERVQGLKAEVNQLLSDQDQPIRYPSQADPS